MRRLLPIMFLAGCQASAPMTIEAPARVRQALTAVTELVATAQLVPKGGTPGSEVALVAAADGVSFSGFLAASPGEYTLEIVFHGRASAGGATLFLGRLTSDGFSVLEGSVATPVFSTPIDPIGTSADHGDDDGDGLGVLDEILFGTDIARADSDGDGLPDGQECDPANAARAYSIVLGGSIEDCDGDRSLRPDLPYGTAGNDCDDRNPLIHPGAEDGDCSDGVDNDCNPATCPVDDRDPPVISAISPAADAELGCHSRIFATITDNSTVSVATALLTPAGGTARTVIMTGLGQGRYRSSPLHFGVFQQSDPNAQLTVEIAAVDSASLRAEQQVTYRLRLDVPQVTRFVPASIPVGSGPFMVEIDATAPTGVRSTRLLAMPRSQAGFYRLEGSVELASVAGGTLRSMVDPAVLPTGEWIIVPIVEDVVGNRLEPSSMVSPIPMGGETFVSSDYICRDLPTTPMVPSRNLSVGSDAYRPTTMLEHLAEARSLAAGVDPNAAFVKVIGFGIRPDGKIALDDATSFSKRWEYGFYNPTTVRWITVSWFTPAFATQNPVVEPDAGNVVEELALLGPDTLVDSDAIVAAYALSPGCPALTGSDDDAIIYHRTDVDDSVYVSGGSQSWLGTPHTPVTEVFGCQ